MPSNKRIIDLQTAAELGSDEYVMIDGATNGTKKYLLKTLKDEISDLESGTGFSDGAVKTAALDDDAVTNAKLADSAVGTANVQNGAITLAKIASGSDATVSASGLMSSTDKAKLDQFSAASNYALKSEIAGAYIYRGSVPTESSLPASGQKTGDVYNIVAASSYGQPGANVAWNGSEWDALGETFSLGDNTITTAKIVNLAVTEGKLATGAVTTEKLGTSAVTETKLAASAVTENKLAASAVTTNKINNGAITAGKLASDSVTTEKISDGNVTANKLGSGSVTTPKIADGGVTEGKLASDSVGTAKIKDANVTTAKIANLNVTEGKLANSAVTTDKLNNGAITTPKIADGGVITDKLADLNVTEGKLANAAVTTDKVADGAITRDKLNEEVTEELDFKADVDGYYTDMTVGAADNLTSRGDAVAAEYLYRTSGGTADIETGQATIRSIKGNTLQWNQLIAGNMLITTSRNGITCSKGSNTLTYNGTSTSNSAMYFGLTATVLGIISGHKYLYATGQNTYDAYINVGGGWNPAPKRLFTATESANDKQLILVIPANAVMNSVVITPQLFDLTAMFGAGNEPSTVAEFEAYFPEPYYPYSAGELLSVQMEGIETTGFNQWDVSTDGEQYEGHYYIDGSVAGYAKTANTNYNCYCVPVFPSTEYCLSADTGNIGQVANRRYLDADKQFISGSVAGFDASSTVFTTPAGARYVEIAVPVTTTKKFCINLHWSGRRDGEYEPFWSAQRLIDAGTLRRAGNVYDEQTETERITRVGEYTFNGSNYTPWISSTDGDYVVFGLTTTGTGNGIKSAQATTKYALSDLKQIPYGICTTDAQNRVYFTLSETETTKEQAAAYLAQHPITAYIALATPIVTPIDPPLNLSYRVDDWGTERIMVPTGEMSAPPVLDIAYGLNVVDFVRRAPSQYISAASFAQYLLARDAHDGTTTTMTWDDTNNRYEFTITDVASIDDPSS